MIDKKTLIGDTKIIDLAPSIFTTTKSPKVSDKYSFIPTIQVLEDMDNLGWEVFNATQRKSRNSKDSLFTKHMVRLRNKSVDRIGDSIPEIVLENSHDGRNAFRLHAGLFRLVCSNGLVIADTTFEQIKIKHQWYNFDEIKNVTDNMLKRIPEIINKINTLNGVTLNLEQQTQFAQDSINVRWEKGNENINVDDLLSPTRKDDRGDELWKVFNVIQEKLIKGGLVYNNKREKMQKLRPIINIDRQINVNKKLWELAEAYV